MWRRLSAGVDKGDDVRQLEENLVALGFADPAVVTVDDTFTSATAAAVKRWQKARGLEQTGAVEPTDVVFAAGPVRVADAQGGRRATSGGASTAVLEVTGAEQIVTVQLDTGKASVAKQDDAVTIELGDDRTINGTVRSVGTVVHTDSEPGLDVATTSTSWSPSPAGRPSASTTRPSPSTSRASSATGVLAVPVRALLALAEGGYAVERVTATGTELVPRRARRLRRRLRPDHRHRRRRATRWWWHERRGAGLRRAPAGVARRRRAHRRRRARRRREGVRRVAARARPRRRHPRRATRASSSPSSDRRGRARARCSTSSARSTCRRRAPCTSPATTSPSCATPSCRRCATATSASSSSSSTSSRG